MVEEFFKSISIVFYEALCCGIFLNMFLESGQMVEIIIRFFADRSVFVLGINYSDGWTLCFSQYRDYYKHCTVCCDILYREMAAQDIS